MNYTIELRIYDDENYDNPTFKIKETQINAIIEKISKIPNKVVDYSELDNFYKNLPVGYAGFNVVNYYGDVTYDIFDGIIFESSKSIIKKYVSSSVKDIESEFQAIVKDSNSFFTNLLNSP